MFLPKNPHQVVIIMLIFIVSSRACASINHIGSRVLEEEIDYLDQRIENIINLCIQFLSRIINFLKRALVLTAMLFLIESLINFWVLASAYAFLAIQMPEYFSNTISQIYIVYNQSFLSYLGFQISYPDFTVQNEIYAHLPNSSYYQFNFFQFALEPTILLTLTLVELSFIKWVVKKIKKMAQEQRSQYLNQAIKIKANKLKSSKKEKEDQQIKAQGKKSEKAELSMLMSLFRSNKVENEDNHSKNESKRDKSMFLELTYKVMELEMKKQLNNQTFKHWSEDIHINKMQKIAALIINYLPGLLIPAFSLFFDNKISNLSEKTNLLLYYLLLGLVFLFPFLYISRNSKNQVKSKSSILKSSDIETISQYCLNMCMSITLGIRASPIPFISVTFVILSALLVYSFMEGSPNITCKQLSFKKVNNIIHKLTFWLYNFVFLGMYFLIVVKNINQSNEFISSKLDTYGCYCSIICVALFVLGGCHQLIEFAIQSLITIFKFVYMICEASNKQTYEDSKTDEMSIPSRRNQSLERDKQNQNKIGNRHSDHNVENVFGEIIEGSDISQQSHIIRVLQRQIVVHQVLLNHLTSDES